jgi:hypothetical protein
LVLTTGETLVVARAEGAAPRCTSITASGVEVGRLGRGGSTGAAAITRTVSPSWLSSTWMETLPVGPSYGKERCPAVPGV